MSAKLLLTHHSLLITHHFRSLTSSDEMNNLDAVSFGEARERPIGAANDFAVALHGEAFGGERELFDEVFERRARLHFAFFSIDFDAQEFD